MVLVDTSVWVRHLREGDLHLYQLLTDGQVASHPFVVGECALGSLKNRSEILTLLEALPMVPRLEDREVLHFIDAYGLFSRGIGLVDVHLVAAAQFSGVPLWTADKRLVAVAQELRIAHFPSQ